MQAKKILIILFIICVILVTALFLVFNKKTKSNNNKIEKEKQKTYDELIEGVNIDSLGEINEENISYEGDKGYINNRILIYFKKDCKDERKAQIINSINGKVVGGNKFMNALYIQVEKTTLTELKEICKELEKHEEITTTLVDELSYTN